MRIDLVAASWEAEPLEHTTHITELAVALSRQGHEVALHIRRHTPDQPESEENPFGFRVVRVPAGPPSPLSGAALIAHLDGFAAFLDRAWAERAPDVVHLHSWMSGLAVSESDAPLVQSLHGFRHTERQFQRLVVRRRTDMERLVALAADRVVTAAADEAFELVRLGVPGTKVSLVPWGVDTDLFHPEGPAAPRGAGPRLVALGEVAPHSGFHTAITALAAVPDAELLIVGPIRSDAADEDPEVLRLVGHARRLRVGHRVRFTGRAGRADLPALLRSADVALCVPSREPSGVAAAQAMACGVPVVASAVGALADLVVDGSTGVLVPARAPLALGVALRGLLADPALSRAHALAGAERVRVRYSWDRVAAEVAATYRKAIRHRRFEVAAEQ